MTAATHKTADTAIDTASALRGSNKTPGEFLTAEAITRAKARFDESAKALASVQQQIANNNRLIVIVGATGTGKSALAINLAKLLRQYGKNAEIISCDASQLYRGMDIATAKLSREELREVPHHLIDVLDVTDEASVAAYQQQAREIIRELQANNAVPILVGGSGLYINSTVFEMQLGQTDPLLRTELEDLFNSGGIAALRERLNRTDPAAAAVIDTHNPRRVIRAIEVKELTGESITLQLPSEPKPVFDQVIFGVHEERETLVKRLDERVEEFWQRGLLTEAAKLIEQGIGQSKTASRAIGYAQAISQLAGDITEQEAIAETKQLTRRYSRKQVSWFKRLPDVTWITTAQSQQCDTQLALLETWLRHGE